jgi:hypothetical protein
MWLHAKIGATRPFRAQLTEPRIHAEALERPLSDSGYPDFQAFQSFWTHVPHDPLSLREQTFRAVFKSGLVVSRSPTHER